MAPSDNAPGSEPVDPVYEALFRPNADVPDAEPDEELMFEPVMDPVIDPRDEGALPEAPAPESAVPEAEPAPAEQAEPTPPESAVDTGRLFRSQGVTSNDVAVLALTSDHGGRLHTLERSRVEPAATATPVAIADAGPIDLGVDAPAAEAIVGESRRPSRRIGRRTPSAEKHAGRTGITAGAVYIIVIGVTLLVGLANAMLASGDIGWPTGLALAVSTVYCALTVRRDDDAVAIITPPIAFLVTALTAGQFFLGTSGGSILNRAVVTFFTLADNWFWIIGSTVAALVIVVVRRRR